LVRLSRRRAGDETQQRQHDDPINIFHITVLNASSLKKLLCQRHRWFANFVHHVFGAIFQLIKFFPG